MRSHTLAVTLAALAFSAVPALAQTYDPAVGQAVHNSQAAGFAAHQNADAAHHDMAVANRAAAVGDYRTAAAAHHAAEIHAHQARRAAHYARYQRHVAHAEVARDRGY